MSQYFINSFHSNIKGLDNAVMCCQNNCEPQSMCVMIQGVNEPNQHRSLFYCRWLKFMTRVEDL